MDLRRGYGRISCLVGPVMLRDIKCIFHRRAVVDIQEDLWSLRKVGRTSLLPISVACPIQLLLLLNSGGGEVHCAQIF
jgi:hypothetical protein